MTVEFWNAVFQWGSVVLVALTFVFVAGALWTSNQLTDRQTARLLQVETELAQTQRALGSQPGRSASPEGAALVPGPPRVLDASARAILLDALKQAQPEGPLEVRFVSGSTTEPAAFAKALADVIEEAGWTLSSDTGGNRGPALGIPPVGLLVRIPEFGEAPPRALKLQEALDRAGMTARIERLSTVRDGVVELMVGLRP